MKILSSIRDSRGARYWILSLIAAGLLLAMWLVRDPPPSGPLVIGFANSPPYHFPKADGRPSGAAYEVVAEAAKRAQVELKWVYCPEESEAALRNHKVDLWPIIGDFPDRRRYFYISDPWMGTDYFILARKSGRQLPRAFNGTIGYSTGSVRARLLKRTFPSSTPVRLSDLRGLVDAVCTGHVAAGIFEAGESKAALEMQLPACAGQDLQAYPISGLRVDFGIGANTRGQRAADRILAQIHVLAREGFLLSTLARYSIFDVGDITATYSLMQLQDRQRLLHWSVAGLSVGLLLTLVLCLSLYRAKQAVARADAEKGESVIRYTLASHATNDAIWDWNPTTGQVRWSELMQELFGYSSAEVGENMAWREVRIHPDDRDSVVHSISVALAEARTTWSAEYRFRRKNGRYASVMDRGCIVYAEGKKPLRMVGAMADITHQRVLEQQLRQSQKMEAIGRLAGGVAHDFNNLLTVITGYSQFLLNKSEEGSPFREYAGKIQKAATSAASLTQQLLAFGRRQMIEPKPVDLRSALAEAEGMVRRLLGEDIEMQTVYGEEPCTVLAEVGQVHQVVLNLAANARDAMPGGGKLLFQLSNVELGSDPTEDDTRIKPGPYVLLTVSDTGAGMDEETKAHIFEPFYTTKGKGMGTGLGLSTVHGIVEQNGGWIMVCSEPGQGTTFKIHLPRVEAPSPTPDPGEKLNTDHSGAETILIVEDHTEVRRLASEWLGYHGYRVVEATTAEEALSISERWPAVLDLMVTDVVLPGMSGRELAERVGLQRPDIKILYVSGYTEDVIAHRGILLPGIAFLAKPFSQQALLEKIREVLNG